MKEDPELENFLVSYKMMFFPYTHALYAVAAYSRRKPKLNQKLKGSYLSFSYFTGWSLREFVKLTNLEFLPSVFETQGKGNPGL